MSDKKELTFNVSNMKCGGCVSSVESALAALEGVDVLSVSLDDKKAVVKTAMAAGDVAEVITAAGFPAELAE